MRWTDNSMGSNFGLSWGTSNQAFAAGQIGMFVSGSDVYTNMVQADNINPSIYGLAPIPTAKSKNAGVLGGGTLAAVSPKSSPAQIAAAMKWINFYYMHQLVNRKAAIRNAKTLIKNKQPVGVPELPVFNQAIYSEGPEVDQAVHQRSGEPVRAVQQRDLQGERDPGAGVGDTGHLRRPRLGRAGGVHQPGRRSGEPPRGRQQRRPDVDPARERLASSSLLSRTVAGGRATQ